MSYFLTAINVHIKELRVEGYLNYQQEIEFNRSLIELNKLIFYLYFLSKRIRFFKIYYMKELTKIKFTTLTIIDLMKIKIIIKNVFQNKKINNTFVIQSFKRLSIKYVKILKLLINFNNKIKCLDLFFSLKSLKKGLILL